MHDEIARLARHVAPRGTTRAGSVAELAQPVLVVGSTMPVGQLEVIFRRPEVGSVAVQDDAAPARTGIVTRAGLTAALTGRLGYGRAVLERRPTGAVADWSPLVVDPGTAVADVAALAMARTADRRYDDVLVSGPAAWGAAGTADVMRAVVAELAERSTHDPLTRLPGRAATWYALRRRCALVRGGATRVVLVLLDVRGLATVNAHHGQDVGDAVLSELAARVSAALPAGCEAGRVEGDGFAVLATLPAMDDIQAAASADALRQHVLAHVAPPSAGFDAAVWPALHSAAAWSVAGAADADELVTQAERRLLRERRAAVLV
ncbi:sensor domain-containing diguanylate cyclase [Krasilnikoviella flava]|uniref:Diguanylate cyclase (GGDEF) domain-containing protein n=1 Tax=Krasilnikoviella flava TaxID=526729 RepID=A0A1T5KDQ9_9MICO|nr:GGDEF domain-containing protein [Krasilnikoviella flava]SKC61821.1 diguanylate cyclase (GGDEF) domain-containing protein [Krasilnikoviella flava]